MLRGRSKDTRVNVIEAEGVDDLEVLMMGERGRDQDSVGCGASTRTNWAKVENAGFHAEHGSDWGTNARRSRSVDNRS